MPFINTSECKFVLSFITFLFFLFNVVQLIFFPFHSVSGYCSSGKTTLSASGILLPETLYNTELAKCMCDSDSGHNLKLVITVASVIESFLKIQHRENLSQVVILILIFFFTFYIVVYFIGMLCLYCYPSCFLVGST